MDVIIYYTVLNMISYEFIELDGVQEHDIIIYCHALVYHPILGNRKILIMYRLIKNYVSINRIVYQYIFIYTSLQSCFRVTTDDYALHYLSCAINTFKKSK